MHIRHLAIAVILLFSFTCFSQNVAESNKSIDSIIAICRNTDRDPKDKLALAYTAQEMANNLGVDSIKIKVGRTLAIVHMLNDDLEGFAKSNAQYLALAQKIQDSFSIRAASANLGSYYRYNQQNDTAFYYLNNALKYYGPQEVSVNKAQVLYMIADVQHVAKIYDQAEVDAIRSLEMLQELEKSEKVLDDIWGIYNLLAIIASDLENYDQAIAYYNKSMEYSDKIADAELNKSYSLNNIANAYRKKGDYDKALEILTALKSNRSVYNDFDPAFYGTVLNNIALTKMQLDDYSSDEVARQLGEARDIAYEYEDNNGKVMTNLDLAKFYLENTRYDSVRKYANEALKLANDFSSNEAKQSALYLLAEVTPGAIGKNYLKEHIRLGDSLDIEERTVRNKIARIKFDTEQLQARNEQISKENLYLVIVLMTLLASGVFVFIIVSQRARNKELKLKQVQQEANEEIYNLLLEQQDKIEEARASEKTRVSKELHDGILGRLFGVRLSLDSLNFSEGKDAALNRGRYMEQLKTIEEDIRKISHEMNTDFIVGTGFADMLQELVDTQSEAYKLESEFSVSDAINWDKVSNKTKINLYRIVQESMQNIYKHAEATEMNIAISLRNNDICLSVTDNGKGFEVSKQKKGIGLKNIASRVTEVNGKIEFNSKIGEGTTVKVLVPWNHL